MAPSTGVGETGLSSCRCRSDGLQMVSPGHGTASNCHAVGWSAEAAYSLGWCRGAGERGWGEAGSGVVWGEGGSLPAALPGKLELHCGAFR